MGLFTWPRPKEVSQPPPSLATPRVGPAAPLTYVYTQRREPNVGPEFLAVPDDQFNELLPLNIAWQDAPDPVRQSNFYREGNKIHPDAQMRITSHLRIASIESVMQDRFEVGKLLGYIHRPMYAGGQLPSIPRANIQEGVPTTYGSQYQVQPLQPAGGLTLASGLTYAPEGMYDGYPY